MHKKVKKMLDDSSLIVINNVLNESTSNISNNYKGKERTGDEVWSDYVEINK